MRWNSFVSLILVLGISPVLPTAFGSDGAGAVEVHRVNEYPLVDGDIEALWNDADSVVSFYQLTPNEGAFASEPTTAYVLQDNWAIYFAFRCRTLGRAPDAREGYRDSQEGDYVKLFLDTFGDGRRAYYFGVNAAGVQADGILSANGREDNISWDAEFYSNTTVSDSGYTVEIAIPWSSIKCPNSNDQWGFNLTRHIPVNGELAYAVTVRQNEGLNISKFGRLTGVEPTFPRASVQLYPSSFVRLERSYGESSENLQLSGDITLEPNSWIDIQTTFNPDFSQIEADPFALNLSKYQLFFEEKRLFFVEGAEYFRPSGGTGADLLQIFYSRQIGVKEPDGSEVPLNAGVRMTAKKEGWELGSLNAVTGRHDYVSYVDNQTEPRTFFTAERVQYQPWRSTVVGLMYVGKHNSNMNNQAVAIDATYSSPTAQVSGQLAGSQYGTITDKAVKLAADYSSRHLYTAGQALIIGDEFNVSEIGYVPWFGYREYALTAGPVVYPETGPLTFGLMKVTLDYSREYGEAQYSRSTTFSLSGSFRNNWGAGVDYTVGKLRELGDSYNPKALGFFVQTDVARRVWDIVSFYSTHSFNYLRGFFARNEYITNYFSSRFSNRASFFVSGSAWVEHGESGGTEEVTYRVRPGINLAIIDDMNLSLYEETPITRSKGTMSLRFGLAFSYNFLPKSWFHIGFNELQVRRDGSYEPRERVFVAKFRQMITW